MTHDFDLIGYLDKSISRKERGRVEDHLKVCRGCREELKSLQKSEVFFGKILARNAEVFCPDSDELVKRVAGESDLESREDIEDHLKMCDLCRERMDLLEAAAKAKVQMPDKTQWEPLPQDLLEKIKQKPLRERLRTALLGLKAKGKSDVGDLLDHIDDLADRLLTGPGQEVPSFALERDVTLPPQTELELRLPQAQAEIQMELGKYSVTISSGPSGLRIKVTDGGKPVSGIRVSVKRETGERVIVVTDHNGEILI